MINSLRTHESRELPIGLLNEPPLPSRLDLVDPQLDELAQDIRQKGVLQHLIVVPDGARYEIIAGHRRYLAAKRAGLSAVPCDVYPSRDAADEAVQFSENRFRKDLSPAEEAVWFDDLLQRKFDGDVDRLCAHLGERRDYVEARVNLFRGDEHVFNALRAGTITLGVAQQLNRCTEALHRRYLLLQAIEGGATVALVSGWIADWKRNQVPTSADPAPAVPAAMPGPVPTFNYFRCRACDGTEHVHLMRPINFHEHCILSTLDPALALFERKVNLRPFPRTVREANALIDELIDAFPEIAPDPIVAGE